MTNMDMAIDNREDVGGQRGSLGLLSPACGRKGKEVLTEQV